MKILKTQSSAKRGAALVEYGLIVAGVALVSLVAVSVFGGKTAKMFGVSAAALPGATDADNGAIVSGKIVRTEKVNGEISLLAGDGNTLQDNLGIDNIDELVVDPTVSGGN